MIQKLWTKRKAFFKRIFAHFGLVPSSKLESVDKAADSRYLQDAEMNNKPTLNQDKKDWSILKGECRVANIRLKEEDIYDGDFRRNILLETDREYVISPFTRRNKATARRT